MIYDCLGIQYFSLKFILLENIITNPLECTLAYNIITHFFYSSLNLSNFYDVAL